MHSSFINITLHHGCSPVNLLHIFRRLFPKNTSGRLLLKNSKNWSGNLHEWIYWTRMFWKVLGKYPLENSHPENSYLEHPPHFINCYSSLKSSSIDAGGGYTYIQLPGRKILISPEWLRVFSWNFGKINSHAKHFFGPKSII